MDGVAEAEVATQYDQDPKSHVLFFRSVIDRVPLAGGHFTVTTDNLCFASRFLPGVADKVLNIDWKSGNDVHWNEWIARCGGYDAVKARLVAVGRSSPAHFRS